MVAIDPVGQFVERMQQELPRAIEQAFGGETLARSVTPGVLPLLLLDLGEGHHVHLELEASAGRLQGRTMVLVLRAEDATQLFGIDPVEESQLGDPETQLRMLAEFTEAAEALAGSLITVLGASGSPVSLRVSGASLEAAENSPIAAAAPLGEEDAVAFSALLHREPDAELPIVVAAPPDLAAAIGAGIAPLIQREEAAVPPPPQRPADPASPRVMPDPMSRPAPAAPPISNVVAHPFVFGQLDGPTAPSASPSARGELGIDPILDVVLQVRVELGSTEMTVEDVLALTVGSVVELDRLAGEPVDIVVNNRLLARGEVVVVEENFGVRVTEIIQGRQRAVV